ncbi:DUF1232 domain-containing protein [Ornithinibacillus sp. L9]|uniref:DUF1232 domain-containing protein n=1 Tax=Ornithinibacillus caprae TaxID=2678566 RepID=A0A6N8FKQ5_9BACI|nr:DUF1232 domain-containing protein [Ornithinibacillus caprae]MUK89751.1 DUF1232 domain-containing protein [Ornithinibacillus caprae]
MSRFVMRLGFLFQLRKSIPFFKDFFFAKEVSIFKKALFLFLIIGYIIFPLDLIPDFLLGFGVVDDITIAILLLQLMVKVAPHSLKEKHQLFK